MMIHSYPNPLTLSCAAGCGRAANLILDDGSAGLCWECASAPRPVLHLSHPDLDDDELADLIAYLRAVDAGTARFYRDEEIAPFRLAPEHGLATR